MRYFSLLPNSLSFAFTFVDTNLLEFAFLNFEFKKSNFTLFHIASFPNIY